VGYSSPLGIWGVMGGGGGGGGGEAVCAITSKFQVNIILGRQ